MTRGRGGGGSMSSGGAGAAASPSWKTNHTEFVAVILASSITATFESSRLDPLVPTKISSSSQDDPSSSSSSSSSPQQQQQQPPAGGLLWWLPVAGISLLDRLLLGTTRSCGFTHVVLVLAAHDRATRTALVQPKNSAAVVQVQSGSCDDLAQPLVLLYQPPADTGNSPNPSIQITVWNMHMPSTTTSKTTTANTATSLEALRQIEEAQLVPWNSHVVILPGDLVILNAEPIRTWIHQHRQGQTKVNNNNNANTATAAAAAAAAACSVLLVDVGEVDEQGHPLKESAKQKKGLLARVAEEQEHQQDILIDYTALTFPAPHRLLWKQSKTEVEHDKDMVGSTPKLILPRHRLLVPSSNTTMTTTRVSTDWNDVHCYVLAPWVRRLIVHRSTNNNKMRSIQQDLIPLLVARQFRGIRATFGSAVEKDVIDEVVQQQQQQQQQRPWNQNSSLFHTTGSPLALPFTSRDTMSNNATTADSPNPAEPKPISAATVQDDEYTVLAHVVTDKSIFRAHTLASYLYANREVAHQVSATLHRTATTTTSAAAAAAATDTVEHHDHQPPPSSLLSNPCLQLPEASTVKSKFHTVLLRDVTIGEKVTFKQCIVGRHSRLGAKCRLHNVVLGDFVTVGDNVLLQNTAVASHAVIGDHCNLKDCVVAAGTVPAGTQRRGESWTPPPPARQQQQQSEDDHYHRQQQRQQQQLLESDASAAAAAAAADNNAGYYC